MERVHTHRQYCFSILSFIRHDAAIILPVRYLLKFSTHTHYGMFHNNRLLLPPSSWDGRREKKNMDEKDQHHARPLRSFLLSCTRSRRTRATLWHTEQEQQEQYASYYINMSLWTVNLLLAVPKRSRTKDDGRTDGRAKGKLFLPKQKHVCENVYIYTNAAAAAGGQTRKHWMKNSSDHHRRG